MFAPWISHELSQAWTEQQIHVPASWSDVDLALILKPDKGGHKPGDYRPIGLSCPLGKKLLRCIIEPHLDDILGQIRRYPQFAYQKGRSQYDALRKVFTHCAAARAELSKHHKNLHHQWEGHKSAPLFGSLMVTVDLSQAFDKMPRKLLLQGMIDLQLPADLIAIVMAWHAHIHYTVHHSGESRTFAATQGIRQGCSASPILWLIFSHAISSRLEESLGYERLCSLLTIFADDYLAAGVFTTLHELEQLLSCVTVLFKVLRTFGMAVSDTKSQAIIALRGTLAPSIRRRYTRKGQDGLMLRLPMHGDSLRIPLVQQFRYLGAQVSYASFEDATLAFRMQKSDAMYGRLGTALRGRHHLTSAQRIRLWHACLWSTMSYSLTTCGLTPAGHRLLETKVVQQLRAILRLPVHLTHTSNLEVMQQAGLTLPCVTLAALMDTEGQRKPPDQDDHLCRPGQAWWIKVRESLNAPPTSSHIIPVPTPVQPQVCPECGVSYNTRAALLTHIARHHHEMIDQAPPEPYQQQQDSVGGLPQCSHCKKKFPTWQLLKRHVEGNYCSVRHSFLPQPPETDVADHTQHDSAPGTEMPPTFDAQPVQTLIAQYAANAIFHLSYRHQYRQHCLICGQWVASSKVMHPPSVPPTLAVVLPASTVVLVLPSRDYTSSPVRSFGSSASASKPSMESTAMDQEIKEVFGNLAQNNMTQFGEALFGVSQSSTPGSEPPSKAPKLEAQMGKRGRAPDNPSSRGHKDQDWAPTKGRGKGNKTSPQIHQLVHAMGRLIIRQETQLQILKQNSAWNLYLQPGQAGPVALLCQAAAKYREEAKTRFMEVLVRALLLHTLFQALLKALQSISGDSNEQQILKDKGWLNAEGNWNYQQWDGEQQALKVNEAKPPMGHQDLIGRVGQLTELVLGKDVIHRFNATHTLTPNKTGVATFLLEVGLRAQGVETTWNTLELLAGLSALQVIGLQIRREGLRRGGLANDVQKLLYASAGWCCTILPTSVTLTLWLMLICGVIIGWRLLSINFLGKASRHGGTSCIPLSDL
ncbi:LINE-1 retrotransposable element ORF2 protein [Symbiodinium microadriaticum]|uniref:LINE-1 retrotransposable element ORF2 protein n=1 Tax=Symbiodinium microadriaticum TaxID=2951 RepID=A0A1Q9DC11_SYMMI|nr:LINE-1 retrotransposable element ORF2 protein [Symbiodinium microadriaticum]